jgi:hypothetical protein
MQKRSSVSRRLWIRISRSLYNNPGTIYLCGYCVDQYSEIGGKHINDVASKDLKVVQDAGMFYHTHKKRWKTLY